MSEKKILVLSEVFYPESFVFNDLVLAWKKKGFQVDVLTRVPSYPMGKIFRRYQNKVFQQDTWNDITIYRIGIVKGYADYKVLKILNYLLNTILFRYYIKRIGKKHTHIFICQTGPLLYASAALLMKKKYNIPFSIWTFDIWPEAVWAYGIPRWNFFESPIKLFVKKVYTEAENIMVSSKNFARRINSHLAIPKNIEYVPNWTLLETQTTNTKVILQGNIKFTFAGNIGKFQNLENVIKGFHLFAQNNTKCFLHIIGDGSNYQTVKKLVDKLQIANVILHGRKLSNEMSPYFNASDILLVSLSDTPVGTLTMPGKVQTYISMGKPIFGIISGETKQFIEEYKIGWTAPPNDIQQIALVFDTIAKTPKELTEKIVENVKNTNGLFDKKRIIEEITTILFH